MHTRRFPGLDRELSAIGLGGMALSIDGRPSEAAAVRVVHEALDLGVTLIDTADVYCMDDADIGHNERLIAKAVRSWSGDATSIVIASKCGLRRPNGDWVTDGRPAHLRAAVDKSLAALGVERITLHQLHAPDDRVPLADSVGELARLRAEGKIEHVGLSNVSVDEIEIARAIVPIVSVQNRANAHDRRSLTNGVLAHCDAHDIAFLPYSPVGGGRGRTRIANDATLLEIGRKYDASPHEISLAWLLAKSPRVFPIPGASRVESLRSSVRAERIQLAPADVARIDGA